MKNIIIRFFIVVVMAALFITGPSIISNNRKEVKAATTYVSSQFGESKKCGSYYIKYSSKGLYKKKSGGSWKKIVGTKSQSDFFCGFSSDGKNIYYAENVKYKGVIYKIGIDGKNKKTIYKAKHAVNVEHYYSGKILYKSDVTNCWYNDGGESYYDATYYYLKEKDKKYTKVCSSGYGVVKASGKYVVFSGDGYYYDENLAACNLSTGKSKTLKCTALDFALKSGVLYYFKMDSYETNDSEKYDTEYYTGKVYALNMDKMTTSQKSSTLKVEGYESPNIVKITDEYIRYIGHDTGEYKYTYKTGNKTVLKKPMTTAQVNYIKLKNYVDNYGSLNVNGNRFISISEKDGNYTYKYGIMHDYQTDGLTFIATVACDSVTAKENTAVNMILRAESKSDNVTIVCTFGESSSEAGYSVSASIDKKTFDPDDLDTYFDIEDRVNVSSSNVQKYANNDLKTAFYGWDACLDYHLDMSMKDLGFTAF